MKHIAIILLALSTQMTYSQTVTNLFINGSFTGSKGEAMLAPGWQGTLTPDLNDEQGSLNTSVGFIWHGTPIASPSGGTWQNMFGPEAVRQSVELIQGQMYSICFDYAAQGIYVGSTTDSTYIHVDSVGVDVFLDSTLIFSSPADTTQHTWESSCFDFVSTSDFPRIAFRASSESYVAIDNAVLTTVLNTGFESFENKDIKIIQTQDGLKFNGLGNKKITIEIVSMSGNLVDSTKELSAGVYFYRLYGNGVQQSGKFIVSGF